MDADHRIQVSALRLSALIGIDPAERHCRQQVRIDIDLGVATPPDGNTPRLNYASFLDDVRAAVAGEQFDLLEDLAERIAKIAIDKFGASDARIRCAKPKLFRDVEDVAVQIVRKSG